MTALVSRPGGTPDSLPIPPLPDRLLAWLRAMENHAEAQARWKAATPEDREAMFVGPAPARPALVGGEVEIARQAAAGLADSLAPIAQEQLRAWLAPINAAVRNPQSREDFDRRCAGLWEVLNDLPCGCFTAEARRRLPEFFPSAADIRAVVSAGANRLRDLAGAVLAAQAPPPKAATAEQRAPRTLEEIAGVRATVQAFQAAINDASIPADLPPVKPRLLSDGHLLSEYERIAQEGGAGAGAARCRADALRARLQGADPPQSVQRNGTPPPPPQPAQAPIERPRAAPTGQSQEAPACDTADHPEAKPANGSRVH